MELNTGGFDLGNAHGTITIDFDQRSLNQAMSQFDGAIAGFGAKIGQVGQQMQSVGSTLTKSVTLPLVGIGVAATKLAIDFESAFAGVRKTVDLSEEGFAELESRLLEMATSPEKLTSSLANADVQLARIAELAGQLGVSGVDNLAKFTETIGLLGVTTNIAGEEGALALAQFANITNLPIDQIDRLGSVIVDLGNNMATTERDILEMSQRIAGAGNIAGLTQDQIFALGAALSSVGIRAEAGGTAISRILLDINSAVETGDEKLSQFAAVANISADEFAQAWEANPAVALNAFIVGLQQMQAEGGNITAMLETLEFSDIRVRDSLLRLIGSEGELGKALGIANSAWQENTALTDEAAKRAETTESSLNRLFNNLRNVGRELGDNMAPALQAFADDMVPVLQHITTWIGQNPELVSQILKIAAVAAIVGPALFVVGKIVSGVGMVVSLLTGAFNLLRGAILGVIGFALTPLGFALAVGAALVTAYANNWLGFRDFINQKVRPAIRKLLDLLAGIRREIDNLLNSTPDWMWALLGAPGAAVKSARNEGRTASPQGLALNSLLGVFGVPSQPERRDQAIGAYLGTPGNPLSNPGAMFGGAPFAPPMPGGTVPGGGITVQGLTIHANNRAGGEAAAVGFGERLTQLLRGNG